MTPPIPHARRSRVRSAVAPWAAALTRRSYPVLHAVATAAVAVGRGALHWASLGPGDAGRVGFAAFGERSFIRQPYSGIVGAPGIAIGADTLIGSGVNLAAVPQDEWSPGDEPLLRIGSRVWVAPGLHVVAHRRVEIGDDVWIGPGVYITDADHDRSDPDVPIGHRMAPARPVRIGAGSWLGTGVVVLSGVTIGERVTVGANSVVCDDLPDGSVAVGAPARVVREASALPSAADDDQRRAGGDQ